MTNVRTPVRIPLPNLVNKLGRAHAYPFQIGMQTLEFLQAAILHASVLDIAAGRFVRLPNGLKEVEKEFLDKVGTKDSYDKAWGYLEKYQTVFQEATFQSVLIALISHWDWYVRNLGAFIIFARESLAMPSLAKKPAKDLARFDSLPMQEQLLTLEHVLAAGLGFSDEEKTVLQEMSLVRNLGLHNRWEIDDRYLKLTRQGGYTLGEIRAVQISELAGWHLLLVRLINTSCSQVAQAYAAAPEYP